MSATLLVVIISWRYTDDKMNMEYIHPYILYVAIAAVCEEKTEIVDTIKVFFFFLLFKAS